jgi:osmotically inducible lipoprotein OsmB
MQRYRLAAGLALLVALAGCGTTTEDRALSGGALGAAGGAVIGALTGSWAIGAVVGAASGVAAGALTTPEQVNLGKPAWKGSQASAPASGQGADAATVRSIQSGLARLGYDPGAADGVAGQKTRAAILRYQQDNGLRADGQPSSDVASHISARL